MSMVESIMRQAEVHLTRLNARRRETVPAAELNKQLDARLDSLEELTGRRPRGKAKRALKEELLLELLPKAFAKDINIPIWISPSGLAVIGTSSWVRGDEITSLLAQVMPDARLSAVSTRVAPDAGMADWLLAGEAQGAFTLDRECELKQPDGDKAVVRYSRHALEIEEIGEHIKQGKRPTRVALTHGDRVSFVLTDAMVLRKIEVLDVALEAASKEEHADAFDADVAIETGELLVVINDLIDALGGEQLPPAPVQG
jgi:recombination associated protein RdgC